MYVYMYVCKGKKKKGKSRLKGLTRERALVS